MITFQVDLFHPGAFAKGWRSWFHGFREWRRILSTYVTDAVFALSSVGINVPSLYDLYRRLRAPGGIFARSRGYRAAAKTTFHVDLLNTGGLAKTWLDWFVAPEARKRLIISYSAVAFVIIAIVGMGMPKQSALSGHQQAIAQLTQKIAQRRQELEAQRAELRDVIELAKYEIFWSGVLRALSDAMPRPLWLKSIEFVEIVSAPKPQVVAAREPQEPSQQHFRLVLVTPLVPGTTHLAEINKFLSDLNSDSRFKEKFRLQDWEVTPFKVGRSDQAEEHLLTTVTFKVVS